MHSINAIGVTGLPGAGKATVVEVASKLGYGIVTMGDEVREETKRRSLKPTPENIAKVMLQLRQVEGVASIAKRCILKVHKLKRDFVIIDGVRSLYEVDEFRNKLDKFKVLAIHSSPDTRFKRLSKRRRSDDPISWDTFRERDSRELDIGIGNVIATADFLIINEGEKTDLKEKVFNCLKMMKCEQYKDAY